MENKGTSWRIFIRVGGTKVGVSILKAAGCYARRGGLGKHKNAYRVCKLLSIKDYLPYSDILGGGVCLLALPNKVSLYPLFKVS